MRFAWPWSRETHDRRRPTTEGTSQPLSRGTTSGGGHGDPQDQTEMTSLTETLSMRT